MWGPLGVVDLSHTPLPTQNPGHYRLAQLPAEILWSLPKKPCPLCCLLAISPYTPPFQCVFKSLGCPSGREPHLPGPPLVSCQAFCKEKPLGERWKRMKKINFQWPLGKPRVFARNLWCECGLYGLSLALSCWMELKSRVWCDTQGVLAQTVA